MQGVKDSRGYRFAGIARGYTQGGVNCPPNTILVRGVREDGDIQLFRVSQQTADRMQEEWQED